jgi:hypothetical protein
MKTANRRRTVSDSARRTETTVMERTLERSSADERVEDTESRGVQVLERPNADLADDEAGEGDEETDERSSPDGDDVCEDEGEI